MSEFGILTFYNVINYGAALQAYALQEKVKELGKTSEFIRFADSHANDTVAKGLGDYLRALHNVGYSIKTYLTIRKEGRKQNEMFTDFQEKLLNKSKKYYLSIEELKADEASYKGFITGSDMVWSDIGQNLEVYFLTFAPKIKRLSYAPSLTGRDGETLEEKEKYANWINQISYLSCREQYGVDYIRQNTGREAKKVVDPTLLFDKSQWKEKLTLSEKKEKPYILCYLFRGITRSLERKVKQYAKDQGMEIKYIPMSPKERMHNLKHGFSAAYGPKEFVEEFLNAELVFTNSFHGLLFSLIMNKPFYLLHRGEGNEWAKHEERMTNILTQLDLQNRFVFENQLPQSADLFVDYDTVNEKIKLLRNDSISYLSNAINSVESDNNDQIGGVI